MNIQIIDLHPDDAKRVDEAAMLLMDAFGESPNYCPDMEMALEEMQELLEPGRISCVPVDEQGTVLGLAGALSHYEGRVWEVHPLAVRPEHQRTGIGCVRDSFLKRKPTRRIQNPEAGLEYLAQG